MEFSQDGINLLKQLEGFRAYPYKDQAGNWTIGYGTRINCDSNGNFSIPSVDDSTATELLSQHVQHTIDAINQLVSVRLSQPQFDALVIFTYNVGESNFAHSTMLKLINQGNFIAAANQFDRWDYVAGRVDPGLLNRRNAEKKMFIQGTINA